MPGRRARDGQGGGEVRRLMGGGAWTGPGRGRVGVGDREELRVQGEAEAGRLASTLNPKPLRSTLNPKTQTLNPKTL